MKVYAMTKQGNHDENEDRILIGDVILTGGSFETEIDGDTKICIADGVGGNNAGAVASDYLCKRLKTTDTINRDDLLCINADLIQKSNESAQYSGMASTLSGMAIKAGKIDMFHVGNTRINVFRGSYLKQLTEDHTNVNWLVKTGKLTKSQAETYEKRNEINACFGGGNPALINSLCFEEDNETLKNAKKIVLTSDGIHEYVSIDDLEEILSDESINPLYACEMIVSKAIENGSEDDKSIVIIYR